MTTTLKAIDTRYAGHLFRSRLEARWAVAFDAHGIAWDYEPEGFDLGDEGLYLPDFWLPQVSMWAEVKPVQPSLAELLKAQALAKDSRHPVLLLIGKPAPAAYWAIRPSAGHSDEEEAWTQVLGEGPDGETLWAFACDYSPFDQFAYHLNQSRFYCMTGATGRFPNPIELPLGACDQAPIAAALSARFEHGHSGSTS